LVIDFSKVDVRDKPTLVLKTLSGNVIQTLGYAFNLTADLCYNEVSEITFDIPAYVDGAPTPNYDKIVGMTMIDMIGYGQFILRNPKVVKTGVKEIKSCQAYSLEYEFTRTKMSLENATYNFWNPLAPSGTILGIIREYMPDWSIGTVDSSLIGKYRTFEENDINIYNFIKSTAQTTYSCVFDFDTYERVINVRDTGSAVSTAPVFLSLENLIKEIDIEEDTDNIFTCLDVNGADGVNIRSVNPMGINKIYNLDYFMDEINFSSDMIGKWNAWKTAFEDYQLSYYNLSIEKALQTSRYLTESAALSDLQGELQSLENLKSVYIQAIAQNIDRNDELTDVNLQIKAKKSEISTQEELIESGEDEIVALTAQLVEMNTYASLSYYFTDDEMALLRPYFKEDSIEDSSFVAATVQSYNTAGVSNSISSATVSFSDSVVTKIANTVSKDLYSVTAGTITFSYDGHELQADVIRASIERKDSDGSFVLSAYLSTGSGYDIKEGSEFTFTSGCVSTTGTCGAITDNTVPDSGSPNSYATGTSLSFSATDMKLYFTRNTTEYEQRSIEWDLFDYGMDCLSKLCYPSYTFSIDSANFFALEDFVSFARQIRLGQRVYIDIEDSVIQPILVQVKIDFEKPSSLSLQFGDKYSLSDSSFSLVDLLDQSISMGKTVNLSKYTYSSFVDSGASTSVKAYMDSALDVARNAVLSSTGQGISWDESGLHCRQYDSSGVNYEPEQIRIINNNIVFTDDNWETAKMAIGKFNDKNTGVTWGIVCPSLVGTILAGNNLVIESTKQDGGVSVFRVDGNGAALHNATFDIYNGSNTQITLNPYSGIAIGNYPLYTDDAYTINTDNAKFWVDTSGNIHLKGTLEAADGVFSGELKAATGTFSGALQAATGTFSGNLSAAGGTFKGDVQANAYYDKNGNKMMTSDYQFTADYLELKGLSITNDLGQTTFTIDSNGNVSLVRGSISWANINETESAAYQTAVSAESTADDAYSKVNTVDSALAALKTNLGYTYINSQYVISPNIVGGVITGAKIQGGKYYNTTGDAYFEVGAATYGDFKVVNGDGNHVFTIGDGLVSTTLSAYGVDCIGINSSTKRSYPIGTWDFTNTNVIGLETTATFG